MSQIWEQKRQTSIDKQGKTRKWLAGQLGKNEATISRWCSNTSQPSLEMLMKIAAILNVDARRLINNGIEE
ncbi:helix-turn-helix transcriptional regulator [Paraprevotella xylaniphila]|uniref:helix-turn-helix transcriptional regulator n=1 Tax=Paraprevotella xylaniphila TaxID=454155 RepID=UPI0024A9D149|nr:helix-turn-helix transcriptional regulator [Paraprevotella xylaniphila]